MSIYREEAIDSLIACLRNRDFPDSQVAAAETIMSLQGRFTTSGKPLTRAFLLKRAGLDKSHNSLVRMDQLSNFSAEAEETIVSSPKYFMFALLIFPIFLVLCFLKFLFSVMIFMLFLSSYCYSLLN